MLKRCCLLLILLACPALAEPPKVEYVSAHESFSGTWRFEVTISHPDTGWNDYADAWRVLDMDGNELGLRRLAHPHMHEQPFTRSLSGVRIPPGTERVQIQARDVPDGWSPETRIVQLRREER